MLELSIKYMSAVLNEIFIVGVIYASPEIKSPGCVTFIKGLAPWGTVPIITFQLKVTKVYSNYA